ncbi:hypothetical protein A1O1_06333 [Capronia coronata CBS 617.96]|uniref:C2H2-type domain-containing protein n=1 Tax=Capronia coronata CBS 617.96 TaxID=1182541 RepID=W9YUK3_9EURO|nr:uncharacterized protein A1O1_06333 [Capronia coronata CBS 617.96]EXJ85964.1 hypothetical protein A1O1_06333 [Capronia coronata CBS 617.96]
MPGPHKCNECTAEYTTPRALREHNKCKHQGQKYRCPYCSRECNDASDNSRHKKACKLRPAAVAVHKYVCAWHSCTHSGDRNDNVARHMKACALKPANLVGTKRPIKVHSRDLVDSEIPDVSHLQVGAPLPPLERAEEPMAFPGGLNGAQYAPVQYAPLVDAEEDVMVPPMALASSLLENANDWTAPEDPVLQELAGGFPGFDQGAGLAAEATAIPSQSNEMVFTGVVGLAESSTNPVLGQGIDPRLLSLTPSEGNQESDWWSSV